MEHSFNIEIAKTYGIEEAIVINNLFFWIRKNEANEKHFHDGRYWTYNTNKALSDLFPYISESKMFRVLKHLEEEEIIIKGNYNEKKWDRTCWYSFTDKGFRLLKHELQNEVMHFSKMQNGDLQNEVTIPYNKTTDSKHKEKEDTKKDDLFEDCWKSYRRKGSKAESKKEWMKLTEDEKKQVKEHIPYYVSSQSEKTYQKDFERYLKKKIFNNVVYKGNTTLYDPEQMNNIGEYRPKLDGFNLRWIESENCYMTPFDFSMLIDGYSANDRPSSAVVMYNGIKYQWNTKFKEWRRL